MSKDAGGKEPKCDAPKRVADENVDNEGNEKGGGDIDDGYVDEGNTVFVRVFTGFAEDIAVLAEHKKLN